MLICDKITSNTSVNRKGGGGFLNRVINNLPIELHLPGYQFCGPGTKLDKRLNRGDQGINPLDASCKIHDIAYRDSEDLESRHRADQILAESAFKRLKASDSSLKERLNALLVGAAMKTKVKFGMGVEKTVKKCKSQSLTNKKKKKKSKKTCTFGGMLRLVKSNKNVCKKSVSEKSPAFEKTIGDMIASAKKIVGRNKKKNQKKITVPPIIRIPKSGGILPLIPLFAGLSALGSLIGGAATVAKTVLNARKARQEVVKNGSSIAVGDGMYLKPYKTGVGLYLEPYSKN